MEHAVLDLGGAALVPELGADVAAGPAGNVELALVTVAALGALPHHTLMTSTTVSFFPSAQSTTPAAINAATNSITYISCPLTAGPYIP